MFSVIFKKRKKKDKYDEVLDMLSKLEKRICEIECLISSNNDLPLPNKDDSWKNHTIIKNGFCGEFIITNGELTITNKHDFTSAE